MSSVIEAPWARGQAEPPLLQLEGLSKRYPLVVANENVSLSVRRGEIHAILGENGAGKSTLMKMIAGVTTPDEGIVRWKGEEVTIGSPGRALALGISMVFQHFTLFEAITVVENISLTVPGSLPSLAAKIRKLSEEFGLPVNPQALVHDLSIGERQRVEIIRCLLQRPSLLILDEPTSVLPPPSVEQLFTTLRRLAQDGMAILYISHKLDEIRALCTSATVLAHGKVSGTVVPNLSTNAELARLMIGKELPVTRHPPARVGGEVRLRVRGLTTQEPDRFAVDLKDIGFDLRAGEILGIAGVSGNGQTLLSRILSGERRLALSQAGVIELLGKPVGHIGPSQRRDLGLSFVPERRLGQATAANMSLSENSLLTAHRKAMVRFGFVADRRRDAFADRCISEFDVRCSGRRATAASLSGGNLQKFVIGREIMVAPKVMIVTQPTWGIDVNASAMVRQRLVDLRSLDVAILVISEEIEELFEISDRLAVMFRGGLSEPVDTRETNVGVIGEMMMGASPSDAVKAVAV